MKSLFRAAPELSLEEEVPSSLAEVVLVGGYPEITDAPSPEAEVIDLLQAAAEIEHALLVEYLYAAFSVNRNLGTLRPIVIDLAIQEMAHLITVQNLLLFLSAKPYFEREDISPNPDMDPFPFTLSGVTNKITLERFLLAEMPQLGDVPADWRDNVKQIKSRVDPQSKFHRVGLIYARIFWLLQEKDGPQKPWEDLSKIADLGALPVGKNWHVKSFPGESTAATTQASRDERGLRPDGDGEIWLQDYGRGGVFRTIASRADALQAIFDISAQGEGVVGSTDMSHFTQIYGVLGDYASYPSEQLLPVPENPQVGPTAVAANAITDPAAAILCKLFNVRYQIMVVALTCALWYSRTNPTQNLRRQQLVGWAFFEMREAIKRLARYIVLLPCKFGGSADVLAAAPTFQLDGLVLPEDLKALEQVLAALHDRAKGIFADMQGVALDPGAAAVVAAIKAADLQRYPTS